MTNTSLHDSSSLLPCSRQRFFVLAGVPLQFLMHYNFETLLEEEQLDQYLHTMSSFYLLFVMCALIDNEAANKLCSHTVDNCITYAFRLATFMHNCITCTFILVRLLPGNGVFLCKNVSLHCSIPDVVKVMTRTCMLCIGPVSSSLQRLLVNASQFAAAVATEFAVSAVLALVCELTT